MEEKTIRPDERATLREIEESVLRTVVGGSGSTASQDPSAYYTLDEVTRPTARP